MQFNLLHHPATPPSTPELKVWAKVDHAASLAAVATTNIWFGVGAPAARFAIPETAEPERADELWKATCFEAFLRALGGEAYREWNFAPSGQWAAYDFRGRRTGMSEAEVLAKLGHPDMTVGGKNGNPARWTYMPAPGDPETITSLTLSKGTVTEVDRKAVRK